ncbi:hypothetical protein LINPERPRIM_LOCUS28015, partial [Linum perenne]
MNLVEKVCLGRDQSLLFLRPFLAEEGRAGGGVQEGRSSNLVLEYRSQITELFRPMFLYVSPPLDLGLITSTQLDDSEQPSQAGFLSRCSSMVLGLIRDALFPGFQNLGLAMIGLEVEGGGTTERGGKFVRARLRMLEITIRDRRVDVDETGSYVGDLTKLFDRRRERRDNQGGALAAMGQPPTYKELLEMMIEADRLTIRWIGCRQMGWSLVSDGKLLAS